MQTQPPSTDTHKAVEDALSRLQEIVLDGLSHGFFECSVTCKVINEKKRQLVISAGKSYHYTITEDELRRSSPRS